MALQIPQSKLPTCHRKKSIEGYRIHRSGVLNGKLMYEGMEKWSYEKEQEEFAKASIGSVYEILEINEDTGEEKEKKFKKVTTDKWERVK